MLSIIVPYRDREEHLKLFIPHMNKYLPDSKIVVVEQADDKPFNRGKLLNIGFLESKNRIRYYCFHDADHLPLNVSYTCMDGIYQLAASDIQKKNFLGGVTMFDSHTFSSVGGYHNDYFHRAEDNELDFHLKRWGIKVMSRFGEFKQLPHMRNSAEFIPELWQKAQLPRTINMLETCKYELISKEVYETHTHIKVSL